MAYLTSCEYCGRMGCHGFTLGKYTCSDCAGVIATMTESGTPIEAEEVERRVREKRSAELDAEWVRKFGCPPPKLKFVNLPVNSGKSEA